LETVCTTFLKNPRREVLGEISAFSAIASICPTSSSKVNSTVTGKGLRSSFAVTFGVTLFFVA
jgi:hypothetical protein